MATSNEPMELAALRIPMRDGVALCGDAFVTADAAPRPAIVELTPYGRGRGRLNFSNEAAYWVGHGYAFLVADCRGCGDSEGQFRFFAGEGDDGHDLVEWVARQPWCNGRVGMRGASYTGANQWHTARTRPPSLRAIVPNATACGRDDVVYDGGAFSVQWALSWPDMVLRPTGAAPVPTPARDWQRLAGHRPLRTADQVVLGRRSALYQEFLDHPPHDDAYWAPHEFTAADYAGIEIPVLAFSGWFDGTLRGTLAHDRGMRAASPAAGGTHLIVGPWEHASCSEGGSDFRTGQPVDRIGSATLPPQAFVPGLAITRAFFDAHLKGEGGFQQPAVRLYLTGSERWIETTHYPPPQAVERSLYLRSQGAAQGLRGDGALSFEVPADEPADALLHDPAHPAPATLAALRGELPGPHEYLVDAAALIDRADVLVYLSAAATQALDIVGDVRLELHVAADAADADFVARLEDVAPDGSARRLGSRPCGVMRARYRAGFAREQLLQPHVPEQLAIALGGIGHTVLPGHRLRLSIAGSAFPYLAINSGSGSPVADDEAPPRPFTQRVYHDHLRASRLVLPCLAE